MLPLRFGYYHELLLLARCSTLSVYVSKNRTIKEDCCVNVRAQNSRYRLEIHYVYCHFVEMRGVIYAVSFTHFDKPSLLRGWLNVEGAMKSH